MAFRNIFVESPAAVSVRREQLVIRTERETSVPLEDVNALLIESRQTTLTAAALAALGANGCAVYFCDEKHLPCAVLEPFARHSRSLGVLETQLNMSEPLRKRLWQSTVQAKIRNQALCLELEGKTEAAASLRALSERVRSGDPDNVEATAAARYFPLLFGNGFIRGDEEDGRNSALNYGYAILRGAIARSIAAAGLLPALGLHHKSGVNPMNLADDLMEPFRPVADLLVSRHLAQEDSLTPAAKQLLFSSLSLDILSGGQHHSVSYAMEREVQSLKRSLDSGKNELLFPKLLELGQHSYE